MTKEQTAAIERMRAALPVRRVTKPMPARAWRRNYQLIINRYPGLDIDAIYRNPKYAKQEKLSTDNARNPLMKQWR